MRIPLIVIGVSALKVIALCQSSVENVACSRYACGMRCRNVRELVAWALGEMKENRVVQSLGVMLLKDEQAGARRMAAWALGEIRDPKAVESLNLDRLKVFDNLTLLKMWCETTAATIFPKRKIGYLKVGYEASFLVLSGNPLEGFRNVKRIEMRVKQGEMLSILK